MKEYGGLERKKCRGDETWYIVIYYGVLFIYLFILYFLYSCVCMCVRWWF